MQYDKIIIGAGLYGLYSALYCGRKGEKILVIEKDSMAFMRATYINQARVHMGYHYPRSYSTAIKSAGYFDRFCDEFSLCIHSEFDKIYATTSSFSWTNAQQFKKFCSDANIFCEAVPNDKYFKDELCDGTFLTKEYTFDAHILRDYFLNEISKYPNITIEYNCIIEKITKLLEVYEINIKNAGIFQSSFVLNSTYASVNQILNLAGFEPFKIKYELCEIILCKVSDNLLNLGITVMDGPFFSIMPFGKIGLHSLTAVTFTPHVTSKNSLPTFSCQQNSKGLCSPASLANCNDCAAQPTSAWNYMSQLAKKFLKDEFAFEYEKSLYSIKPILMASEVDDSRPTVIKQHSLEPTFYSVLSGKINTIYDLDRIL